MNLCVRWVLVTGVFVCGAAPLCAEEKPAALTPEQRKLAEETAAKFGGRLFDEITVVYDRKLPTISVRLQTTDADLKNFPDLPFAFGLRLGTTKVTDAGMAELKRLKNLTALDLSHLPVGDDGLKALGEHPSLAALYLPLTRVTDSGMKHLKGLKRLEELDLGGTKVTDAGLDGIKELTTLRALRLNENPITDEGMKRLKGLTNLTRLEIYGSRAKISAAGFAELREVKRLEWLALLNYVEVTDEALREITRHKSLKSLHLMSGKVTDAGVKELKNLPDLEALTLSYARLTDAGVKELRGLKKLTSLDLAITEITDASIADLKELKNLKHLGLFGTKITDEGVKRLREALPNCNVRHKISDPF